MDTKYGTPGALDNGAGLTVLMKLSERMNDVQADVEFVPFNTEEYYGADGELLYLEKMKENNENTDFLINIDSVGHIGSKPALSFYNISDDMKEKIMKCGVDAVEGEQWYAGDHVPFVFMGIPCLAVTSSDLFSGGMEHMHTPLDTVNDVDVSVLEETVQLIHEALRVLYNLNYS